MRLLITTDEHGWLEPWEDRRARVMRGGVAEAHARMTSEDGLGDPDVVLLSSGDMWTGPYESTTLKGAPMVDAFNRMGYRAAAVGNHEYDFGLETLAKRSREADFPFLAANLRLENGEIPEWARPYTIVKTPDLRIGVIGFTNRDSLSTAHPHLVSALRFIDYHEALPGAVKQVLEKDVDLIVVLIHDSTARAVALTPLMRELGVSVVGAGHDHSSALHVDHPEPSAASAKRASDATDLDGTGAGEGSVVVCNAGAYLRSYCRVDVTVVDGVVVAQKARLVHVERPLEAGTDDLDRKLVGIVEDAQEQSHDEAADEVLAVSPSGITRDNDAIARFVAYAWLRELPKAQVAITNRRGIRQDLAAGKIRTRDVVSLMPFDNHLVIAEISGRQLREVLAHPQTVAAGLRYTRGAGAHGTPIGEVTNLAGTPISGSATVRVVTNDFIYWGGDGYRFAGYDPDAEHTAIDWRTPVISRIRELGRGGAPLRLDTDGEP